MAIDTNHLSETLSDKEFKRLGDFIQSTIGIKMPEAKKVMVEGRLRKRLRILQITRFSEYCDFLFSPEGMQTELSHFVDAITTNKTDFFREPDHFSFIVQKAVPELIKKTGAGIKRKMVLWSAACSTGNEAYTIGMVLNEYLETSKQRNFDYSILATDISDEVLKEARLAIYHHEAAEPIPPDLRMKYLMRSKDRKKNLVRIVPWLRKKVIFRKLNLMSADFGIREQMDIIFCRNVMIYFDKPTQDRLIEKLCRQLRPGGYLFMGHSEVLKCDKLPLTQSASSVYLKKE